MCVHIYALRHELRMGQPRQAAVFPLKQKYGGYMCVYICICLWCIYIHTLLKTYIPIPIHMYTYRYIHFGANLGRSNFAEKCFFNL